MQETRGKDLPTENKPKTIKKMITGSYILIITLNISGLNAQPKDVQVYNSTYHSA